MISRTHTHVRPHVRQSPYYQQLIELLNLVLGTDIECGVRPLII